MMKSEVAEVVRGVDLSRWRTVDVEYGDLALAVRVPESCRILEMKEVPPLRDPAGKIRDSIRNPIGSPSLAEIVRGKGKRPGDLTVCVATSDITRPVPYKGESGILLPLFAALREAGIRDGNVTLLVGTGTHRPSTRDEKVAMFGEEVVAAFRIADHECDDAAMLDSIGTSRGGTEIRINKVFRRADVKIATGLVESHFMAGVSAGRKAICPALVSRNTIERFHSAEFLDSPLATNLVLSGNPCHEEALDIARKSGVDFIVSTVLNRRLELVGVFSGDLVRSHERAADLVRDLVAVPVEAPFEVVLTHGGYVGINHYQNAKAAVNALPIVRENGFVILAARERDVDPVGPATYKTMLHLLKLQGPDGYLSILRSPSWTFTKDQWEPQMWGKVIRKIGERGLIYCSSALSERDHAIVPGGKGWDYLPDGSYRDDRERTQAMVQNAVVYAVGHPKWGGRLPSVAFVREGPYAVPSVVGAPALAQVE